MSEKKMSLARCVALITALIVAGFTLLHLAIQYLLAPESSVSELLLEHGWHIVILGALTYVVFHVVLHRMVVQPIHTLYVKLYALAKGDRRPVIVESRIAEVQEIAEGINMLLARPHLSLRPQRESKVMQDISTIRTIADKTSGHLEQADRRALLNAVSRIEALLAVSGENQHADVER